MKPKVSLESIQTLELKGLSQYLFNLYGDNFKNRKVIET